VNVAAEQPDAHGWAFDLSELPAQAMANWRCLCMGSGRDPKSGSRNWFKARPKGGLNNLIVSPNFPLSRHKANETMSPPEVRLQRPGTALTDGQDG